MTRNQTSIIGLIAILFACSLPAGAQTTVGIQAGVNFSSISIVNAAGERQHTEMIPRLQAGIAVDIPLAMGLYLQPAAMYVGKGFKQDGAWLADADKEFRAAVSYVEIPVTLRYKKWIGIGNLLVGAGPYVGYGVGGTWEAEGELAVDDMVLTEHSGNVIFKNDVADGELGKYLYGKPWDYGANVVVGYQFSPRMTLQLQGQFGIANLAPDVDGASPGGSIRNRGYGLAIAYGF
ncbi:MAG TPA: outer membrane beta-barrel protein [Parapedobacter sp.]|nr:outer membrane beta-barrel protein [Parapedobacter sp.]